MALAARLSRYKKLAWFIAKYSRADFVKYAGLEPVDTTAAAEPLPAQAEAFARDLESLGPTFIKLGQLLSTRGDLLPQPFLDALARLQDDIAPFPYADVERIVDEELGVRLSKAFAAFDQRPIAEASMEEMPHADAR